MRLANIYDYDHKVRNETLWHLLEERTPEMSISHKEMPTYENHEKFVDSHPYAVWYFIVPSDDYDVIFGTLYVTVNREIGIQLFEKHQGYGVGTKALQELRRVHQGPFYANIAPTNERSMRFFERHGFVHIQNTYRSE